MSVSFEYDTESLGSASREELLRQPDSWPLLYEMVKNMERRQLFGLLERSGRHLVVPRIPLDFDERYERRVPARLTATAEPVRANTAHLSDCLSQSRQQTYEHKLGAVKDGRLTFVHTTLDIATENRVKWFHGRIEALPELWGIKFHGFEFLKWAYLTADSPAELPAVHTTFKRWIRDWESSPETRIGTDQYLRRAWTPHAVSLRLLNLIRYYVWCEDSEDDTAFLQSVRRLVFKNALFLENHVEHDVGGNHLIENGIALVTAGVFFEDEETSWLSTGLSILDEATEQFLEDGGHFERSPMYHSITLMRYLTAVSLLVESDRHCPENIRAVAREATGFLSAVRPPDGQIPLLNDAVYGQAMEIDSCLEYGRSVGAFPVGAAEHAGMEHTGYYWLGDGADRLLVDGGPFGPRHLPGHSHNDIFSILLWVDGTQILTDTGTYHYDPGPRRQYSRSVCSHNTVQVGDTEPVPIGGQYLAGKRVNPEVQYAEGDCTRFDGIYRRDGDPEYSHRRRISGSNEWWLVEDTVRAADDLPMRQYLHFHPSVDLGEHPCAKNGFELSVDGQDLAYVLPVGADDTIQRSTPYFPEFRLERMRPAVIFESETPGQMQFLLSKEPYSPEEYRTLTSSIAIDETSTPEKQKPPAVHDT